MKTPYDHSKRFNENKKQKKKSSSKQRKLNRMIRHNLKLTELITHKVIIKKRVLLAVLLAVGLFYAVGLNHENIKQGYRCGIMAYMYSMKLHRQNKTSTDVREVLRDAS